MRQPAFTVVLKALDEERLIGDAIRSVQAQTRPDFELIVVDDGSTDGTAEVVGEFMDDPRISLVRQENRGVAPSVNVGAARGEAPMIALIDADDLWMPNYLEQMAAALESDPAAGFAYTDAWWLQTQTGRFLRKSPSQYMGMPEPAPTGRDEMAISLMKGNWLFGLTMMRRSAFEQVGGFAEHLPASEDYEMWLRLLANGYRAKRAPGRLVVFRDRADSLSKKGGTMQASLGEVYRIASTELPFPDEIRALAARRLAEIGQRGVGGRAAWLPGRRWLGAVRRRLLAGRIWHPETPAEVGEAFPGMQWRLG